MRLVARRAWVTPMELMNSLRPLYAPSSIYPRINFSRWFRANRSRRFSFSLLHSFNKNDRAFINFRSSFFEFCRIEEIIKKDIVNFVELIINSCYMCIFFLLSLRIRTKIWKNCFKKYNCPSGQIRAIFEITRYWQRYGLLYCRVARILLVKLSTRNNPCAACLLTIISPFPCRPRCIT